MRRRAFLTAASAAVAAACLPAATAPPSASPAPTTTPSPPPTAPSGTASPSPRTPPNLDQLRAQMAGAVWDPTNGYDDVRLLYNTRFDGIKPFAVAQCKRVEDVQACVRFARANAVPVAVRSGGHSYAGWSTGTGLVIDVGSLASVSIGSDSVVAGAGARLIDVYDALASAGLGIGAGSCPTVGIAGLTLGGGIGVLTRAFGLTCDQLLAADVVTADGALRRCDPANEPDLFWALRGGGGGNFGIVTAFRFAPRPITTLAIAFLTWPWREAAAAVAGWQAWMANAPAALWSTLHLEGGATPSLALHVVYPASTAALDAQLNALVAAIGSAPNYRESGSRSYRDVMLLEAGCLGGTVAACHLKGTSPGGALGRETFAAKSIVADRPLSAPAIAALVDRVAAVSGRGVGGAAVLIDTLGGAVANIAPDATAFPHRSAFGVLQLYASWDAAANGDAALAWLRDTHLAARPLIGTGAYVNYIDPDLADWADAYYGANLPRLRAVKKQYDPARFFDFPQAV